MGLMRAQVIVMDAQQIKVGLDLAHGQARKMILVTFHCAKEALNASVLLGAGHLCAPVCDSQHPHPPPKQPRCKDRFIVRL